MASNIRGTRTFEAYLCSLGCEDEVVNDFCHTPPLILLLAFFHSTETSIMSYRFYWKEASS